MNPLSSLVTFFGGMRPAGSSTSTISSVPTRRITSQLKQYVVFDFDETLGYFAQLNGLIQSIEKAFKTALTERQLFELLDAFPEIFRPKIFHAMEYLKDKLVAGQCDGVILYTNNQGPKAWSQFILRYMNYRVKYPVFNKIVAAWKVGDVIIEPCRTTHNKTYDDLKRCASLPEHSRICFIDDRPHEEMIHDDITYILVRPYFRKYYHDDMITDFMKTTLAKSLMTKMDLSDEGGIFNAMLNSMLQLKLEIDKTHISVFDIDSSDEIITGIRSFFGERARQTVSNKTRKKFKRKRKSHTRKLYRSSQIQSSALPSPLSSSSPSPAPASHTRRRHHHHQQHIKSDAIKNSRSRDTRKRPKTPPI